MSTSKTFPQNSLVLSWLEGFWCSHCIHWNVQDPKKTTTESFFILRWFGWSFRTLLMPVPPHTLWIWDEINISELVAGGLTLPHVGDRPFITELSVSIKLSLLLWQQHYSSGLGLAKQRLLSCSHLLLPIDRCSLHYQHRGYLHDTATPRMLMMLLSACRMFVSWGGERERRRERNTERKEEIKRDCTQRLSREWRYNEVLDRFNTNNRRGHCRSQVLLISPPFLKQIKLSGTACVSIRSGWGPLRTAWFRCLKWISR